MQHATDTLQSDTGARLRAARDASLYAAGDDGRRYLYTDGWDEDDAELGWVDHEVVSRPRRLH